MALKTNSKTFEIYPKCNRKPGQGGQRRGDVVPLVGLTEQIWQQHFAQAGGGNREVWGIHQLREVQ